VTGATVRALAVFCGSSDGRVPAYRQAAVDLADQLVARDITLIYGGAQVGLMGVVADRTLAGGGRVTGVIPGHMADREVAHGGLTELVVVDTMHERKALMAERADGFMALPGGLGTLDELAEIVTWSLLGLHAKPIGLLNVGGYFDQLLGFFDRAVADGFVRPAQRQLVTVGTEPGRLLSRLIDGPAPG
jgi:uncharacterized protein (TIGR00730 family)